MTTRRWVDIAERLRGYLARITALRGTKEDIRYAYRLLLGREPDDAGWNSLNPLLESRRLTPPEIAASVMSSSEFLELSGEVAAWEEVELPGRTMFVPCNDRDIGQAILLRRCYEPGVEAVLQKILQPGGCFIDIGANIGYFTLLAASLVGAAGHVIAVEPLDKNLQCLYAAVAHNAFANVRIHPFAAAESIQIVTMTTDLGTSNACRNVANLLDGKKPAIRAQTLVLDSLLGDFAQINLVKLDVEGMEPQVWAGMKRLLMTYRPHVIIEFHPKALEQISNISPKAFLGQLFEYGTVHILYDHLPAIACPGPAQVFNALDAPSGTGGARTHLNLLIEPHREYEQTAQS